MVMLSYFICVLNYLILLKLEVLMKGVKEGDTIQAHVVCKLNDGSVFASTIDSDPLTFTVGEGQVIPGLEKAVRGLLPGEKKKEKVVPQDTFGEYQKNLIISINRKLVEEKVEPKIGMKLEIVKGKNKKMSMTIKEITKDAVVLDGNHPLAENELTIEIAFLSLN